MAPAALTHSRLLWQVSIRQESQETIFVGCNLCDDFSEKAQFALDLLMIRSTRSRLSKHVEMSIPSLPQSSRSSLVLLLSNWASNSLQRLEAMLRVFFFKLKEAKNVSSQLKITHQILSHWESFRDLKLMFAGSRRAEHLTEMAGLASLKEDDPKHILFYKPINHRKPYFVIWVGWDRSGLTVEL